MKARNLTLIALLICGPALAQDSSLARTIELPAHRALMGQIAAQTDPAPFTTDGCSGGLSQTWDWVATTFPEFAHSQGERPPWEDCCVVHDRAYHVGGGAKNAETSYDARLTADKALRACVRSTGMDRLDEIADQYEVTPKQVSAAYDSIAGAMYLAVRFGGGPCSGLPWRWGYGFDHCSVFTTSPESNR